jgi:predicted AAA+ superfamily ATPase
MYTRLLKKPLVLNKSFFLFGPRGTGKTTWLKKNLPDSLYFDLLETNLYLRLNAHPENLEQLIPPGYEKWVIIDEVQKVPILLNEIHRLIEKYKYRFILTGSSARSLRKKGVNLLAGRALTFHMYPLTTVELGQDFNLRKSLQYGHLPAVSEQPDPAAYLNSYITTYLREEVLQEGLTRNLGDFSRFLETASFSQGSLLNISEVAREVSLDRKKVESYYLILEDLLLADRIPVFTKRAKRRLVVHPKLYFFDVGVYRTLRPMGPLDAPEEVGGISLETLCYQELKAINEYYDFNYTLFYWRTSNNVEVDFILYGVNGLLAIEIKSNRSFSNKDLASLKAFRVDYPEARLFLFYGGQYKEYIDDIRIIPVEEALKNLPDILANRGTNGDGTNEDGGAK